ncbi:MAG: DUF3649 domain-containing protein [Aquabacterium sp.]|uniref:DUF3649 domain-containing protein n=1 Tax=Aquabacterium sp. TaxID=1872578 RepID=UPI00271A99E3|nr:DUF3649 domain-containing protein [Aquabacterium sp.]MDO9002579.1 DUF3649 domain-containing protein [Aquabacterium sp.]
MKKAVVLSARERWAVASRALAAILGGYVIAALFTGALAMYLPGSRLEATLTAMMLSFAVYACAVIWVFSARSAWRAWWGLAVPAAVLGALIGWSR